MKLFWSLLWGLLFVLPVLAQRPVNPNATKEARELLRYLYKTQKRQRIISGHHNYPEHPEQFTNRAFEITGRYPAVWGSDFINTQTEVRQSVVDEAIRKYGQGYIVTLMWHAGRPMDNPPFSWKESIQGEITDAEWQELTTPGSPLHQRWVAQVDAVAAYLQQLKAAKVPVLWRPYHEMNGIWFWWGDKRGEEGFAKLWHMLYDRYVNVHHLDNLLWVWNANAPRDRENDEAYNYEWYYPGNGYVDVLAADVYHNDYRQSHHDQLLELGQGKLIALGEVGEVPTPDILRQQPRWCWFMIWANWVDKANTPEQIRDLYNYNRVLTRDQLKLRR